MIRKIKNFLSVTKKSFSLMSEWNANEWTNVLGGDESMDSRFRKFSSSAYVYACVNKRAEKVSQVEFSVRQGDKEVLDSPLLDLLNKPNSFQTKNDFFYLYQTHKDLAGCAYILLIKTGGKVTDMHLLHPNRVEPVFDPEEGAFTKFKYKVPSKKSGQKVVEYDADEIIASITPSPLDYIKGQSPITAGALPIETEEQLAAYQYQVLKNGGKPEGILSFKDAELTEAQVQQLEASWGKKFSGAKKAGRPLFLGGNMEYLNLGLTPTELSYIESKKMTRDDILMIFGVPKIILSQTDGVNYANAKVGMEVFLRETIKPLVDNLVVKLNQQLADKKTKLTYVDFVPQDVELELKRRDNGIKNGWLTINEVRMQENLDPLPNGDQPLVPFNLTKLSEIDSNGEETPPTK